ncbi:TPA: phage tail protein [Escherichia coli]|nr:phage tail protein [Escherichia coli]HCO6411849.1 phage tail protein [Escherichia coli]HCO6416490.1 phage tail protein [Escherichia coli]HCO6470400.1 phage tail protein [Escherichia coli]HCO6741435.1 phage tail protein [Escherichia coli]
MQGHPCIFLKGVDFMKSVYVVGKGLIVAGNKITIDGKEHVSVENSENIVVTDDCIKIGNKTVVFKGRSIKVEIHGNVNKIVTENADVSIHGNAGDVEAVSGDVDCHQVNGDITTVSGDVTCGDVSGDVTTVSGDINRK